MHNSIAGLASQSSSVVADCLNHHQIFSIVVTRSDRTKKNRRATADAKSELQLCTDSRTSQEILSSEKQLMDDTASVDDQVQWAKLSQPRAPWPSSIVQPMHRQRQNYSC